MKLINTRIKFKNESIFTRWVDEDGQNGILKAGIRDSVRVKHYNDFRDRDWETLYRG